MKRKSIILIIYLGIVVSQFFVDIPYTNYFGTVLIIILFGLLIFEFKNLVNITAEGDLIFYKQTKRIQPIYIALSIVASIGYFVNGKNGLLPIILFWSLVIFDIITSLITKRVKPVGIIIKNNQLILNDFNNTKRDLNQVKSLKLNGFTDEIEMAFKEEKKLFIKHSEYLNLDIKRLISACIEKSKEEVFISENLKY